MWGELLWRRVMEVGMYYVLLSIDFWEKRYRIVVTCIPDDLHRPMTHIRLYPVLYQPCIVIQLLHPTTLHHSADHIARTQRLITAARGGKKTPARCLTRLRRRWSSKSVRDTFIESILPSLHTRLNRLRTLHAFMFIYQGVVLHSLSASRTRRVQFQYASGVSRRAPRTVYGRSVLFSDLRHD